MPSADRAVGSVHTRAGRTIDVAVLTLPGLPAGGTVTISMTCASFDNHERLWLSLSAAEASSLVTELERAVARLTSR